MGIPGGVVSVGSGGGVSGGSGSTAFGPPVWGYASSREFEYEQAVGQQIDLHQQWQYGTWRRSSDPAVSGRYATMVRTGTGRYTVRLPGMGTAAGAMHATLSAGWGYQQAVSCQLADAWRDGLDQVADVACFDQAGIPKNLPFIVVFVGASDGPTPMLTTRYDGTGGTGATVSRIGTGRYTVSATGPFNARGVADITAVGAAPACCRPTNTTAGLQIAVACDAQNGAPVDTGWALSYTELVGPHHDPSAPAAYLTVGGDPASPTVLTDRSWSSNGETPTVARTGVGVYDISYQQIGNPAVYPADGLMVTATGSAPRYCRNWAWNSYSFPPKLRILLYCFDATGQPADSTFTIAYLRK